MLPVFNVCVNKPQFAWASSSTQIFSLSEKKIAFFDLLTLTELASDPRVASLEGNAVITFGACAVTGFRSAKYSALV